MMRVLVLSLLWPLTALAQQPHEQEIQRALIELDRRGHQALKALEPHAGRPLHPDPEIARELRPYERMKAAEERDVHVLRLPPPVVLKDEKPLPLPGRPQAGVDPVTVPRSAN